jgi:hypothetical protein
VITAKIGTIPRDTLRYHGTYPMTGWGTTWERVYRALPPDAVYAIYDQCVRLTGVLPVPPLQFFEEWEEQSFRILKAEDDHVVALYRHDKAEFLLIRGKEEKYINWAQKRGQDPHNPAYSRTHKE